MKSNSLQDILSRDLGLEGSEKTAADAASTQNSEDEISKLAAQVGLVDPKEDKPSEGDTDQEKAASEGKTPSETEKVAAAEDLENMYNNMFPEDADLGGTEKTAEQEKVAYEEKLGGRSFDHFANLWDRRVEKLATELSGDAKISASAGSSASSTGNPHKDSRPAPAQPGNRPKDAEAGINTDPKVENIVTPQSGAHVTGAESDQSGEIKKAASEKLAAERKHLLLAQLEVE